MSNVNKVKKNAKFKGRRQSNLSKPNEKKEFVMEVPDSLPFIEALEKRFNKKIQRNNEQVLLANYEKNWILKNTFGGINGKEERYLRYLAKKHSSFILNQI